MVKFPSLKFIEDSTSVLEYDKLGLKCECCGERKHFFTPGGLYAEEDVEIICYDCIVSGKACEKFDGTFNEPEEISDKEQMREVEKCTPTLPTFQEITWPACCDSMCVYCGRVKRKDVKDVKIKEAITKAISKEGVNCEGWEKMPGDLFIKFRCPKCGEYHIVIDLD